MLEKQRWMAKSEGYFIMDLGCNSEIQGFEIDNTNLDESKTDELTVFGGDYKDGPFDEIYHTRSLEEKSDIKLNIEKVGPYRFLKVAARASREWEKVSLVHFNPIVQKITSKFFLQYSPPHGRLLPPYWR